MKYRQARWETEHPLEKLIQNEPLLFQLASNEDAWSTEGLGLPEELLRGSAPSIPKVPEVRLVRHYVHLSQMNFGVDSGMVPLGSCTMKYTPKVLERLSRDRRLADFQGWQDSTFLAKLYCELEDMLKELTGMSAFSLTPRAGSQGELVALLMIKKALVERGELRRSGGLMEGRNKVLIPLTAHGSNFASASMAGFQVVRLPARDGLLGEEALKEVDGSVAAIMLTLPNTYGLWEPYAPELVRLVHQAGGFAYFDGANMNSLVGLYRPGDLGFDVVQLNLHKTFSSPHGGGGPGAGPVGAKGFLADYLPIPRASRDGSGRCSFSVAYPKSVGRISEGYGNVQAVVRAYGYIRLLGAQGLREVARLSVLNANYFASLLGDGYYIPSPSLPRKHELAFAPKKKRASDVAKFLLSRGYAPSVHFPPELEESMMVEPTETEGKQELEDYAAALREAAEAEDLSGEPKGASVSRVDEVRAARHPVLTYRQLLLSDLMQGKRRSRRPRCRSNCLGEGYSPLPGVESTIGSLDAAEGTGKHHVGKPLPLPEQETVGSVVHNLKSYGPPEPSVHYGGRYAQAVPGPSAPEFHETHEVVWHLQPLKG